MPDSGNVLTSVLHPIELLAASSFWCLQSWKFHMTVLQILKTVPSLVQFVLQAYSYPISFVCSPSDLIYNLLNSTLWFVLVLAHIRRKENFSGKDLAWAKCNETIAFFFFCVCVFKVCTLLNWSQVSVQESPGCLCTSTCSQGDQKPSYISSWGDKKGGHDGWPFYNNCLKYYFCRVFGNGNFKLNIIFMISKGANYD